jgi:outer membrane protein, adhesin transport system
MAPQGVHRSVVSRLVVSRLDARRMCACAVAGLMALACMQVPEARAVTLKEELQFLLNNHPQLKAGANNVAAATEGVSVAESFFLPTINVTGDTGYKGIDNASRRTLGKDWGRGFEKLGVTVTQNIFDGSRKEHDKNSAELNQEAVQGSVEEIRQALLLQAANAYIEVNRQIVLVRLARKSEATIAYQLDLEDERVKRGGGTAVDVLLAKTRLQRSKEQRIVFEGNLRDAVTRYTNLFGHSPDLAGLEEPQLDYGLMPDKLDVAIDIALASNPLVVNSNRQIDIARMRQRSLGSEYFPRLDVVGAANYEDDREGTAGNRRDYSVTFQATWNLFSGFSTRSSVAEAAHGYSASINNHLFVNRRIEEEVRLAWQSVLTSCDRRLLLVNAVTISSEVHASRVRLREAGEETAINVLDAVGEVFNAEINEVAAIYDERLAIYRLAIAMGLNLVDIMDGEYTKEVREDAKKRYEDRCLNRLKTVSLEKFDPSGKGSAPKKQGTADPFAAPKADEDDGEEASNPFAAPDEGTDDVEEETANPFDAKPDDADSDGDVDSGNDSDSSAIETEDDTETSLANPFAESDDEEAQDGSDDDDSLSIDKPDTAAKPRKLEDELDEDDDDLSENKNPLTDDEENEPTREIETELDDDLESDDKVSSLSPRETDETDAEWDDELKSDSQ